MSREFSCKYDCGATLHYDNGRIVQGDNTPHKCPNWRPQTKPVESSATLDDVVKHLARIADALEYIARK